jgi:hypothetical protein
MFEAVAYATRRLRRASLRRKLLRETVNSNLDSALEGGQFTKSGGLHDMTTYDVANDLTLYADDCSGYAESELEPYVRAWVDLRYARIREERAKP